MYNHLHESDIRLLKRRSGTFLSFDTKLLTIYRIRITWTQKQSVKATVKKLEIGQAGHKENKTCRDGMNTFMSSILTPGPDKYRGPGRTLQTFCGPKADGNKPQPQMGSDEYTTQQKR
jgi:hypothetical protein